MTLNVNAVCAVGVPSLSLDLPFDEVISNTGGASYAPRNADYNPHREPYVRKPLVSYVIITPVMKPEKPRPYTN